MKCKHLRFNAIPILLFLIGVSLSYFLPTELHKKNVILKKDSYYDFLNEYVKSVENVFEVSEEQTILSEVMSSFNVSLEEFSQFSETLSNVNDIGSTLYSVKIRNTQESISEFEGYASEIHGYPVKIMNETFQELYNYEEEYVWPILYQYFPNGSTVGRNINFIGFNMYIGRLSGHFDNMVELKSLVYSDPILFESNNKTGLLSIRPVFTNNEKEEVSSAIIRGILPNHFLGDENTETLINKFGSDLSVYIRRNVSMDFLFGTGPNILQNCHEVRVYSESTMLLCFSDFVNKKRSIINVIIICLGIFFTILICTLLKIFQVFSYTEKISNIKSKLIAHFSHELRTPMNAIMGLSELLQLEHETFNEKCSSYIDSIHSASTLLLHIVNEVLDMNDIKSKKIELNISDINLRELIRESVKITWYENKLLFICDDSTRTYSDLPDNVLTLNILNSVPDSMVKGDLYKIKQIISIIISNSLKFTKGGTIHVTSGCREVDESKFILEISFSDTGIGISKKQLKNIFEPFINCKHDTKVGGSGSGMGLSICKDLIGIMGGKITCKSVLGKGTTFYFSCMMTYSEKRTTVESDEEYIFSKDSHLSKAHRRYSKSKPLVLIVDDIHINRILLQKMLESIGVVVKCCNDGTESVDLCKNNVYSVIFMDIFMPTMNGIDATKIIRESCPLNKNTPIIFVSATVESTYINKCYSVGGTSFIEKPVDMDTLRKELENNIVNEP